MAASDTLDEGKSKGILWGFGMLTLVVLIVLLILGAWWGSEPGQFNILEEAHKRSEESKLESEHGGHGGGHGSAPAEEAHKSAEEGHKPAEELDISEMPIGLGYTRAARLVDTMEAEGIVGPYNGSKPRDILIDTMEAVKAKWTQSGRE